MSYHQSHPSIISQKIIQVRPNLVEWKYLLNQYQGGSPVWRLYHNSAYFRGMRWILCAGPSQCPLASELCVLRHVDRRIFTPIDRASYKWKRSYKKRTAIERVNSRLDVSFGFEVHTIRGQEKMQMRCKLALSGMLAMALGVFKRSRLNRSAVWCAAFRRE